MGVKEGWSITRVHIRIATLETLVGLGFLLHFGLSLYMACQLPVFHHCDEVNHFDCVVKLSLGTWPTTGIPRESNVCALHTASFGMAHFAYIGEWGTPSSDLPERCLEAHQPKLFYLLAAAILRLASYLDTSLSDQLVLLRVFCALLASVSRVLIYRGIRNLSRPLALLAAAYLIFRIPVDLLRVSNDSLAAALGATLFFLFTLANHYGRRWHIAAISLVMLCASATKPTAYLYLAVVVVCIFCIPAFRIWFTWRHLVIALAPATAFTSTMVYWNWMMVGNPSGIPLDGALVLIPPEGSRMLGRLLSTGIWQKWQEVFLTNETLVAGLKGDQLYPLHLLTTCFILGQTGVFCLIAISWKGCLPESLAAGTVVIGNVLNWGKCALLSLLCVQAITTVLIAEVGQICYSYRFFAAVEAVPVLAAAIGWYAVGKLFPRAAPVLWSYAVCGTLFPCVLSTIAYLQLAQR